MSENWLGAICWNNDGLVPVIAQDVVSNKVLMMAWMSRETLKLSVETGFAHYWSRSRNKIWKKGEESGHLQAIEEFLLDCDSDVLLIKVKQVGGVACHTGRESCFFRRYGHGEWEVISPVIKVMT
ncbi:phosphoribosyl-AMP cyclohydrolase [Parachitinimonas caeni]|uniref:Phosphoribosyl-AMP cyclohydrolase n=1 Tax=Parachitinimonas caeni TaxID=3031301 RepID=A0ABT7DTL2_9NEIS|nr:phosphoribosyl-AMP cyclohydrolase [Parachitinimonas caeni]MDK2123144.1 phosphoribosyl-AMP cyclohydrolase [Parachitinimonas caeni]